MLEQRRHGGGRQPLRPAGRPGRPTPPRPSGFEGPKATYGWVHSYETGSTRGRPGRAAHALHVGLPAALPVLPQPRHLAPEGRHARSSCRMPSGGCGDFAPALRAMGGGLTISGGEPLVQIGFTRGIVRRGQADGAAHRARHLGLPRPPRRRRLPRRTSIWCCSTSRAAIRTPIAG